MADDKRKQCEIDDTVPNGQSLIHRCIIDKNKVQVDVQRGFDSDQLGFMIHIKKINKPKS